ncbi:MAG: DUF4224 domain-containing protein [Pseudomonadota bacterium]
MTDVFLTSDDVAMLTGRRVKSKQIATLLKMGVPFWVNAIGKPVVTIAAVEGRKEPSKQQTWTMPKIQNGSKKHT